MKQTAMTRREFMLSSGAMAGAAALTKRGWAQEAARPNILLICTDQQHWMAMGHAYPSFKTPHIDRLAREGVSFRGTHCTTPQCSASRSSLYTGLYPHKTTVLGNMGSTDHEGQGMPPLPDTLQTIGGRLQDAGYTTGYIGKWHLDNEEHFAEEFSTFEPGKDDGATTVSGCKFLRAQAGREKPFALFLNYLNPHDIYEAARSKHPDTAAGISALDPPPSWAEDFDDKPKVQEQFMRKDQGAFIHGKPDLWWEHYRDLYREKCRMVDTEVGGVLAVMDELRLMENTIIVFTSDHGDMDTEHRLVFKGPFMYEHLVRVPLIVRVPGAAPGTVDDLTVLTDLVPTLCDFAGADPGTPDGYSLRPYLEGGTVPAPREFVVSQYYNKQEWVNPIRMLRTKDFKYTRYIQHGEELYDLTKDPHELVNLAADAGYADKKAELRALLDGWMNENGDDKFDTYWPTHRDNTRWTPEGQA